MALKPFRAAPLPFLPSCWNTGCCFTTRNFTKGILQREKQVRSHPRSCHSSGIHLPAPDGFGGPSRGDALVPAPTPHLAPQTVPEQSGSAGRERGSPRASLSWGNPDFPKAPCCRGQREPLLLSKNCRSWSWAGAQGEQPWLRQRDEPCCCRKAGILH